MLQDPGEVRTQVGREPLWWDQLSGLLPGLLALTTRQRAATGSELTAQQQRAHRLCLVLLVSAAGMAALLRFSQRSQETEQLPLVSSPHRVQWDKWTEWG